MPSMILFPCKNVDTSLDKHFQAYKGGEYILCGIIMGYHLEIPMPADT